MRTLSSYEIENELLDPERKIWWCPVDEPEYGTAMGKPPDEFLGEAVNRAINTAFDHFDLDVDHLSQDTDVSRAATSTITRKLKAVLAKEVAKFLVSEQRRERQNAERADSAE